jgi:hypothetical protein
MNSLTSCAAHGAFFRRPRFRSYLKKGEHRDAAKFNFAGGAVD